MAEGVPEDKFQERLWGMFHYHFGSPLTLPQIERIRWHLFPEIRISSVQQEFFSNSPKPDAEETVPEIVHVMDLAQEQLARSLGSGHRVIHGVAGSGKTLILGYRCLHLAGLSHKPILVLCFNITLAARLRSFITEKGIADKVQVYHFHEWCKVQLTTYHFDLIASDAPIYDRQVESVIQGVERGRIPRAQYGAVMVDEGHIPLVRPEAAGVSGHRPAFRYHSSVEEEVRYATQCIRKWQANGTPLNEIAVLYFKKEHGAMMLESLREEGIASLWMGRRIRRDRRSEGWVPSSRQQPGRRSVQALQGARKLLPNPGPRRHRVSRFRARGTGFPRQVSRQAEGGF